jgi:phosphopantothenoylcysteine decarboxylase/phosphopantothenate--cysteine ligase
MRTLITAGPTREYFDSVRFISNPSSGRMGYAIAVEAARRHHDVTLVSGPVALAAPEGVRFLRVVSAAEMFKVVTEAFGECDVGIMTAAVCDYRPRDRQARKLKKQDRQRTIVLEPTADILAHLGTIKGRRVLIGFAMEDHDHRRQAEAKLRKKNCDAMVLNDLGNVAAVSGTIEILRAGQGWLAPASGTKAELAARVLDLAESLHAQTVT